MDDHVWTAVDITDHVQRFKIDGSKLFVEKHIYDSLIRELNCLCSVLSEEPLNELRSSFVQWGNALELKHIRETANDAGAK